MRYFMYWANQKEFTNIARYKKFKTYFTQKFIKTG